MYVTTIKGIDQHKCDVVFDFDNETNAITSKAGIPVNELSTVNTTNPPSNELSSMNITNPPSNPSTQANVDDSTLVTHRSSDVSTPLTGIKEYPPMNKLRDDITVPGIEENLSTNHAVEQN